MAFEILKYASGVDTVGADGVSERERVSRGLQKLARTFADQMYTNKMNAIEDSQRQAQTDIIQNTVNPDREENDAAYASTVLRNSLNKTTQAMQMALDDPASELSNMTPDEFDAYLQKEHQKFYKVNSKSPHADTMAGTYQNFTAVVQPGLIGKHALMYKQNMKTKQSQAAVQGLAEMPQVSQEAFGLSAATLIDRSLPSNMFTSGERLGHVMASAVAAAHQGDRRLLDYAITDMGAAELDPIKVQQAENAFSAHKKASEDAAWSQAEINRDEEARSGMYTQESWERDMADPETVKRFGKGTINRWRAEGHKQLIKNQNMSEVLAKFKSKTPIIGYDDATVQEAYGEARREIMAKVGVGDDAGKLKAVQEYAGLLAAQGIIDKDMKADFDAKFNRPVWTKAAFEDPAFQVSTVIFDELSSQLTNEQLVKQLGENVVSNGFLANQYMREAGGDPEKAAELYLQHQIALKDRPPIKGETPHPKETAEAVAEIINGEVDGHDPAMDRWLGLSSASGDAIHTRQIEYEVNRTYAGERERGLNHEAAMAATKVKVGAQTKYFGGEVVWTGGTDLNETLHMPPGSTAKDRDKAWEQMCKKFKLNPSAVRYKQQGQYGMITDEQGNVVEELGMFPSLMIGNIYDDYLREEQQKVEARNLEDEISNMQVRNRMLENGLNARTGFNDKAQILKDGTTLGNYKNSDEEGRALIRKTYEEEHRSWLGKLGQKAMSAIDGFIENVQSGKYKDPNASKFLALLDPTAIPEPMEKGEANVEAMREVDARSADVKAQNDRLLRSRAGEVKLTAEERRVLEAEGNEAEQDAVAKFKEGKAEPVEAQIQKHEGFRGKPYNDSVGVKTVGYGRNLEDNPITDAEWQEIGGKRDLDKQPLTKQEAMVLFRNDMARANQAVEAIYGDVLDTLTPARREVLVDMAFNLGQTKLSKFTKFFAALRDGDYDKAAAEMKNSKWYGQVGKRAKALISKMKKG